MTVTRLTTKRVEKPWGRETLWPGFDDVAPGGAKVGEVWFEAPNGEQPDLLVKYLFTSEKLSIQVHPNDEEAQARGYPRGKDEAWLILAAEPHATIAIGTQQVMEKEELKARALDGTIVEWMDWKPVKPGDTFYSPAGTVHAIGAGLTLIEVQQNVDLTYRLYDYGSDRELHLEDGIAVSHPVPYVAPFVPREIWPGGTVLAEGPKFVMERWEKAGAGTLKGGATRLWLIPVTGGGTLEGERIEAGGVWMVDGDAALTLDEGSDMLVAYSGATLIDGLWQPA